MPGSLTLGVVLLFVYLYFPATVAKNTFRRVVPFSRYELNFDEELLFFYLPAVLALGCAGLVFYWRGYWVDVGLLAHALGAEAKPSEELLYSYENFLIPNVFYIALITVFAGFFGWLAALCVRGIQNKVASSAGINPWSVNSLGKWHTRILMQKNPTVRIDIWTKGQVLYSGELDECIHDHRGDFFAITLKNAYRHIGDPLTADPPAKSKDVEVSGPDSFSTARFIEGAHLQFLASDISNINVQWVEENTGDASFVSMDFITPAVPEPPKAIGEETKKLLDEYFKHISDRLLSAPTSKTKKHTDKKNDQGTV